jgi:copper chaperone CopZ
MKYRLSLAIIPTLALTGLFAWTALAGDGADTDEAEDIATSIFHVTGMTCGGCEVGVRRIVNKLDGVEDVEASHKAGTATVTYQIDKVTPASIIAAIEELGYTAELTTDDTEGT